MPTATSSHSDSPEVNDLTAARLPSLSDWPIPPTGGLGHFFVQTPAPANGLFTRKALAKYLKVSVGTVDNLRRANKLDPIRFGGSVRFSLGAVQKLLGLMESGKAGSVDHIGTLADPMVAAATVRVLRRARGLSQAVVAQRVGTTVPRLRRLETGRTKPREGEIARIIDFLSTGRTTL